MTQLSTTRNTTNTALEHVYDHNTLHGFFNTHAPMSTNGIDDTAAIQNYASDLDAIGGGIVPLGGPSYKMSDSLELYDNVTYLGRPGTQIDFTGNNAAVVNATPGTDINNAWVRDLTLNRVSGTVTYAVDLDAVIAGGLVNVFLEGYTTTGFRIEESDGNYFENCLVDGCTTGWLINATTSSKGNTIISPKIYNATTGISITGAGSDANSVLWPYDVSVTTLSSDTSGNTNVILVGGLGSPGAHASSHSDGGADEINVIDLGSGAQASGSVPESDGAGGLTWGTGGGGTVGVRQLFLTMGA